jgi:hypothetical protein
MVTAAGGHIRNDVAAAAADVMGSRSTQQLLSTAAAGLRAAAPPTIGSSVSSVTRQVNLLSSDRFGRSLFLVFVLRQMKAVLFRRGICRKSLFSRRRRHPVTKTPSRY